MKINYFLMVFAVTALLFSGCSQNIEKKVKSADGVEISYTDQGSGEPALVFVHGWSCDKSYWKNQVPEFSKNYQVVTIDYGGHGNSGLNRKNFTIESFGDDVVAVVNELKLDKIIFIGHSMGGLVILDAASKLQGRVWALIGADTYQQFFDTTYNREMFEKFTEPFYKDFKSQTKIFVESMFPENANKELVKMVVADMSSAPQDVAMQAFWGMFEYDHKIQEKLSLVRVPIYAVNATMWPTNEAFNRQYAESFEAEYMLNCGHFVMLENPELFNEFLQKFVTKIVGEHNSSNQ